MIRAHVLAFRELKIQHMKNVRLWKPKVTTRHENRGAQGKNASSTHSIVEPMKEQYTNKYSLIK